MEGDSFCKMATSRRENVHCCVDIAMMMRATFRVDPFSYFETFPALRPVRLFQQRRAGLNIVYRARRALRAIEQKDGKRSDGACRFADSGSHGRRPRRLSGNRLG